MGDMTIEINSVLRRTLADGTETQERVIWIDEGQIIAFVMDINAETGFPVMKRISEIREEIRCGVLVSEADPWNKVIDEKILSEKDKSIRNNAFTIIENLVTYEPDIYYARKRGPLVHKAMIISNTTIKTINKYLRRYWQRGKNKNALLPDFNNCGGPGKNKTAGERKRGRPRKYKVLGEGRNVTLEDIVKFQKALFDYHFIRNGLDLPETYDKLLSDHYGCDIRYDAMGIKKTILKHAEEIPSYEQFVYWYYKNYNHERTARTRKGDRYFELHNRPLLGNSTDEAFGPGFKWQMDSTIGDIYIVHRLNRTWIVGRPVIYVIIDVFSRMIVGLHISLEGPSWEQASIALANAMLDKEEYCARYGIKGITQEQWPAKGIMSVLFGDRGELAGTMIESASNALNFNIENAPPYRADWKGIVERYFRTINEKVKPLMPGSIQPDFSQRGGRDYRLDAKLDIHQFTQLIIKCILKYNNHHYMRYYPLSQQMIVDDVDPIPADLWRWGVNEFGKSSTRDADYIKISLLPRATARVTEHGIVFKNKLRYSCERALREGWFVRGNPVAPKAVCISYDPRNLDHIYIWEVGNTNYEICSLLPNLRIYKEKTIYEIEYYLEQLDLKSKLREEREHQEDQDLDAEISHYVGEATDMTDAARPEDLSKSSRINNIKAHRKDEATYLLAENSIAPDKKKAKNNSSQQKVVPLTPTVSVPEDYLDFPSDLAFLLSRQEEKQNVAK